MIRKFTIPAYILFFAVGITSCKNGKKVNEEADRIEILRLHDLQREFHFKKMEEDFVSLFSDTYITVNNGEISMPTKKESISMFKKYFESVDFEKWDDISDPIIRFSDDRSIAYEVVNKEVVFNYLNEKKEKITKTTIYSWITIYKKFAEGWKVDCVVSTNALPKFDQID